MLRIDPSLRTLQMNGVSPPAVRFSNEDLILFSTASHDNNPLHLSTDFARKTSYGQQVVFGILGGFACLSHCQPPLGTQLSRISLDFQRPIYLDIDYEVTVTEQSAATRFLNLCDGSRVLVAARFDFRECDGKPIPWAETQPSCRELPVDLGDKDLAAGTVASGVYLPDEAATKKLLARFAIDEGKLGRLQLSALLWSSYLVGMEQPGLRAVFYKLMLSFEHLHQCGTAQFSYEAKVMSLTAFNVLRSNLRLFSADQMVATGESWSFVTPRSPRGSVTTVASLLPPEPRLTKKVALVIGASRGLGAMLTAALALQGCTVLANFKSSDADAQRLQETLGNAPGKVSLIKGDAANVTWCEKLKARVVDEFGRLDVLICNACPPLLPLSLEPKMVERINCYVGKAVPLVSVPLSLFLGLVDEANGYCVVISSISVETTPKEWPHYVAVKAAIEGMARVAALQYPNANFLLVRPPRLETDLTNDPVPHGRAMSAEVAASKIVLRLQYPARNHFDTFRITD